MLVICRPSPNIRGGRPAPRKQEPVRRPGPGKPAPSRQQDRNRAGGPSYGNVDKGRDNRGRPENKEKKKVYIFVYHEFIHSLTIFVL